MADNSAGQGRAEQKPNGTEQRFCCLSEAPLQLSLAVEDPALERQKSAADERLRRERRRPEMNVLSIKNAMYKQDSYVIE